MVVLRSEALRRGTLILPADKARAFVDAAGEDLQIQFEDMNAAHGRRPFKRVSARLDEVERKLRVVSERLVVSDRGQISEAVISGFLASGEKQLKIETAEAEVEKLFTTLNELKINNDEILSNLRQALQERAVLTVARATLATSVAGGGSQRPATGEALLQVSVVAGVVSKADEERLKRTVFRASRGNVFLFSEDVSASAPEAGEPGVGVGVGVGGQAVFVCYFQGGNQTAMREKIVRVCQGFGATLVEWPGSGEEAEGRFQRVDRKIMENKEVLARFREFERQQVAEYVKVSSLSGLSRIEELKFFLLKEKNLYHTLNLFSGDRFILRCDCWFPETAIGRMQTVLDRVGVRVGVKASLLLDKKVEVAQLDFSGHGDEDQQCSMPPTYIKRNEFTTVFQDLVDTYGVPRYEEVNPALFTVVSFPFIFGVMYGDVGHGSMLLLFGIFLVLKAEDIKKGEYGGMLQSLASIRYLVLMMGFFAVFAGFMYNDVLSLGMALFSSRFETPASDEGGTAEPLSWFNHRNSAETADSLSQSQSAYGPYPFGLDPAWHGAQNELLYVNSFKMKLSVVLGVAQMVLGVLLKFVNAWHFKSKVDLFCECVPQLVFMLAIFGYMDWMIMYKWTHAVDDDPALAGAPSIINTLINMGLGQTEKQPLYLGQTDIQTRLMTLALWAVPVMLIPKPLFLWWQHKKNHSVSGHSVLPTASGSSSPGQDASANHYRELEEGRKALVKPQSQEDEETGGFQVGEVVIHQIIETIEYVLGTVSHASSYLRQWALSLAHQQLSLVFFGKILAPALCASGYVVNALYIYVAFAIFMGVTAGVLLGMDVLECFLHTLRLHWVEFQSKFYKADGKAFAPFSHKAALLAAVSG